MKSIPLFLVPLLVVAMAGLTHAQSPTAVPPLINYQAHVTNASNVAVGSGTPVDVLVEFRFWNHATDVAPAGILYSESQTVTINEGDFSVLIGQGGAIGAEAHGSVSDAFGTAEVFLGITVDVGNDGIGNDNEISPRQQLVSTAFAFRAKVAEGVDALAITEAMLGPGAVTANKLDPNAVTVNNVAFGAIKGGHDAHTNAALRGVIVDNSITVHDLANNSVGTGELVTDAVTSEKIKDGEVKTDNLADDAVTADKLADDAVVTLKIKNLNVTNGKLANNAVNSGKIANNTVALEDLVDAVKRSLCPPGSIMAYGGTTAPDGWFLCDGAFHWSGSYPDLFAAIQYSFGKPYASLTYFRVPDFRGKFLRGRANGKTYDPNRTTRGALYSGGATGDNVGSYQNHAFQSHSHTLPHRTYGGHDHGDDNGSNPWGEHNSNLVIDGTNATGGSETRPVNIYVNYIIKY